MFPARSLYSGILALLLLTLVKATTLPGQAADAHQLNSENWKEKTGRGLWYVRVSDAGRKDEMELRGERWE